MSARHVTLLAALSAIWGGSYLLIKYALDGYSAAMIVAARCLLASAVLYVVLRSMGIAGRAMRDIRERPKWALILSTTAVTAPFLLITFGEHVVPSGLTAVLISPASLFIALLAPFLLPSERIDRRQGVGMLLGLAGVIVVVGVESVQSLKEFLGALAMVGAAFFYALSNFVVKGKYGIAGRGPDVLDQRHDRGHRGAAVRDRHHAGPHARPGRHRRARRPRRARHRARVRHLLRADRRRRRRARRAGVLFGAGRGAVLRRDLPRRGDHGRRHRRPGADPGRRGDSVAAQANAC